MNPYIPLSFRAVDGDGNRVEPQTCIFPILKEVGINQMKLLGTGFFITKIGHFVTAKHIIQDVVDVTTGEQTGFIHALHFVVGSQVLVRHITKVTVNNDSDVAVGKMDYHVVTDTNLPLTNRVPRFTTEIPPIGSKVCTFAYPESDQFFAKGSNSKFVASFYGGELLEHSEKPRDAVMVSWPHFRTSIDAKGGSSGGPVFDAQGRVIGVHCIGGIEDHSYAARTAELVPLLVPDFPGDEDVTVLDLARSGAITFDPSITR